MPENPLRGGILEGPEITLIDDAVPVLVHVQVIIVDRTIPVRVPVNRLPVLADVLVDIERVHREVRSEDLDPGSHASGRLAGENLQRGPAERGDGPEVVLVPGGREVGLPAQPPLPAIQDSGTEAELDPVVPHAADVGGDEVRQVAEPRDGHGEEQVVGQLVVVVDRAGDPLIGEPEVEADVDRLGLLPLDVGVHGTGAAGREDGVAELILGLVVAELIGGIRQVISEGLIAGLGPGAPELEVGQPLDPAEERLLRQPPRDRHRRERAVVVLLAEPGRAVVAQTRREDVAIVDVVVEAAEEGDQLALLLELDVRGVCRGHDLLGAALVAGETSALVVERVDVGLAPGVAAGQVKDARTDRARRGVVEIGLEHRAGLLRIVPGLLTASAGRLLPVEHARGEVPPLAVAGVEAEGDVGLEPVHPWQPVLGLDVADGAIGLGLLLGEVHDRHRIVGRGRAVVGPLVETRSASWDPRSAGSGHTASRWRARRGA